MAGLHICYCQTTAEYNQKKKAINETNTGYVQNGITYQTGTPEILWNNVVYIKQTGEVFYNNNTYVSNGSSSGSNPGLPPSTGGNTGTGGVIIADYVRMYDLSDPDTEYPEIPGSGGSTGGSGDSYIDYYFNDTEVNGKSDDDVLLTLLKLSPETVRIIVNDIKGTLSANYRKCLSFYYNSLDCSTNDTMDYSIYYFTALNPENQALDILILTEIKDGDNVLQLSLKNTGIVTHTIENISAYEPHPSTYDKILNNYKKINLIYNDETYEYYSCLLYKEANKVGMNVVYKSKLLYKLAGSKNLDLNTYIHVELTLHYISGNIASTTTYYSLLYSGLYYYDLTDTFINAPLNLLNEAFYRTAIDDMINLCVQYREHIVLQFPILYFNYLNLIENITESNGFINLYYQHCYKDGDVSYYEFSGTYNNHSFGITIADDTGIDITYYLYGDYYKTLRVYHDTEFYIHPNHSNYIIKPAHNSWYNDLHGYMITFCTIGYKLNLDNIYTFYLYHQNPASVSSYLSFSNIEINYNDTVISPGERIGLHILDSGIYCIKLIPITLTSAYLEVKHTLSNVLG